MWKNLLLLFGYHNKIILMILGRIHQKEIRYFYHFSILKSKICHYLLLTDFTFWWKSLVILAEFLLRLLTVHKHVRCSYWEHIIISNFLQDGSCIIFATIVKHSWGYMKIWFLKFLNWMFFQWWNSLWTSPECQDQ